MQKVIISSNRHFYLSRYSVVLIMHGSVSVSPARSLESALDRARACLGKRLPFHTRFTHAAEVWYDDFVVARFSLE